MRKKKYLLSVVSSVMSLMITLCGCGNNCIKDVKKQTATAIIAGVHSNSFVIPANGSLITNGLFDTCYTYGDVAFINVDGNPQVYYKTRIEPPTVSGLSKEKLNTIASEYTVQLQQILVTAKPVVEEVDTLKAIQKASQALKEVDAKTTDKVLIILDSGLSTSGYVDFTKGLLNAEVSDIVSALVKEMSIPDLKEVDVVWAFCGEVAPPQKPLTEKEKAKIRDIWEGILRAGGADSITFSNAFASSEVYMGLPDVSTVETNNVNIEIETAKPIETIVLDNTSIQFVGNKALFVDPQKAVDNIQSTGVKLLECPDNKVYVIGTTASGDADFCNQLSKDRAQAVVDVLISMGVAESQMIPMGMGFEDPWHVDDLDANGYQIENKAAQNRKVLIVDVNGPDAKLIQ